MMAHNSDAVEAIAAGIRREGLPAPKVGLVTGSGLGLLAEGVDDSTVLAYEEIPQFPRSMVAGHPGRLVMGTLEEVPVVVLHGRVHYYEGYSLDAVTLPIRVVQALGATILLVTNASGGINEEFRSGDLMLIRDHIFFPGLAGNSPLRGPNDERLGPRFPAMTGAYDPSLRAVAREVAQDRGLALREGVYAMLGGPTFETPAEIRLLRSLGADAVGMSTAPEVVVARHGGMRVLGLSVISNITFDEDDPTPVEGVVDRHGEVLEVAAGAAPEMEALIRGVLRKLGPDLA